MNVVKKVKIVYLLAYNDNFELKYIVIPLVTASKLY